MNGSEIKNEIKNLKSEIVVIEGAENMEKIVLGSISNSKARRCCFTFTSLCQFWNV